MQENLKGDLKMLDKVPTSEDLIALIGKTLFEVWTALCDMIEKKYDMEHLFNNGGKAWKYEYKYRRDGKTLCALYGRENCLGFMVILGKNERTKFEADKQNYSLIKSDCEIPIPQTYF